MSPHTLRAMTRAAAMVLEMGILVVGGAGAGHWLDERFGTSPLFLLCLSMAMLIAGTYRLHRTLGNEHSTDDP